MEKFITTIHVDEDPYDPCTSVESFYIVGVFDSENKAREAGRKAREEIMSRQDYEVTYTINRVELNKIYPIDNDNDKYIGGVANWG